jgi:hypothetical protein
LALSPQANYTDWAAVACRRILIPTFADRGVSHGCCTICFFIKPQTASATQRYQDALWCRSGARQWKGQVRLHRVQTDAPGGVWRYVPHTRAPLFCCVPAKTVPRLCTAFMLHYRDECPTMVSDTRVTKVCWHRSAISAAAVTSAVGAWQWQVRPSSW